MAVCVLERAIVPLMAVHVIPDIMAPYANNTTANNFPIAVEKANASVPTSVHFSLQQVVPTVPKSPVAKSSPLTVFMCATVWATVPTPMAVHASQDTTAHCVRTTTATTKTIATNTGVALDPISVSVWTDGWDVIVHRWHVVVCWRRMWHECAVDMARAVWMDVRAVKGTRESGVMELIVYEN